MPPMQESPRIFDTMKAGLTPVENPGYLQYWETRGANEIDERLEQIVRGLTRVAIRGEAGRAEYTNREPALQARYWYRSLGPLNPMTDIEPDLITAARMMYGKETSNPGESASLRMDSAYALAELARVTTNQTTAKNALRLSVGTVQDMKEAKRFNQAPASYRLQTLILEGDLWHDVLRLQQTGSLQPTQLKGEEYRAFEKAFTAQELKGIEAFGDQLKAGITDENMGIMFEWYFILANRHKAWVQEELDTTSVRGATSRENAEWTGEDELNPSRKTGNHDVVVSKSIGGSLEVERWQLNLPGTLRRRFDSVRIMDFQQALGTPFHNLDQAADRMQRNLLSYRNDYRNQ